MLRTILIVLLVVMVTVPATAKWEMSEFVILLGWPWQCGCPDDEALQQAMAQAGFNVVMGFQDQLDLAHEYGLKLLFMPSFGPDWLLEHPANWGYYVTDEPTVEDWAQVAQVVNDYHQADPNRPAWVNSPGGTGEYLQNFMETFQPRVLSFTGGYQWWWPWEQPVFFAKLEAYRAAALAAGIPLIRWVEVNANPDAWPPPGVTVPPPPDNAAKLRQSVYTSLCYGVKGIEWFTGAILFEPGTCVLQPCGQDVAAINAELNRMGPILISLESVDVFHTPPLPDATGPLPADYWVQTATPDLVLGMFKDSQDNDYIMVANRKIDSTRQVALSLPADVTEVAKFDKNEGTWIDLPLSSQGNRVVVEFILAPGNGELLKVQTTNGSISGTITKSGGGPLAGVEVTADGHSDTTAPDGTYTITGLTPGTYTVTPVLAEYTFAPSDAAGVDFVGTQKTYSISGTIVDEEDTPLEGVSVTIDAQSTITLSDGTYTISGFVASTYTVTPSLTEHRFTPSSLSATVNESVGDATGVDFVGTDKIHSISGTVTNAGDPLAGVDVTADGKSATTAANGTYMIDRLVAGTYTVTPSMPEYDFAPLSIDVSVSDPQGDATGVDFVGTQKTYTISGTITNEQDEPMQGVELSAGGKSTITGPDGTYTLEELVAGTYSVKPSLSQYDFTPPERNVTVNENDGSATNVDFVGTPKQYTVSGIIRDWEGNPMNGVEVSANAHSATTDAGGEYSIAGLVAGTYTVIPGQAGLGFVFVPQSQDVTVPGPGDTDVTGVDFTGYAAVGHSYSAGLHLTGVPIYPVHGCADSSATDINVAGTVVPTGVPFVKNLGPAWNMIANPFAGHRLPMANIQPDTGQVILPFVYIYDSGSGSYRLVTDQPGIGVARSYLEPWEGAWLYACTSANFTIEMTAGPAVTAAGAEEEVGPQALDTGQAGWAVPVLAHVGNRSDLLGAIGVSSIEPYSLPNPPAALNSVDLYFVGDDGSQLAQSVVSLTGDAASWEFVVATDIPDSEVEVALPDLSQLPNDLAVTLTDLDADRAVYARTMPSYSFRSGENGAVRHFRIEVGPQQAGGLAITTAAAQPGGSGAVITYGVSQACNVTVEVMNISGRVIKTLAADEVATAGTHALSWNLRSNSGTVVPRGMYLVRIDAAAENGQRTSRLCQLNVNR